MGDEKRTRQRPWDTDVAVPLPAEGGFTEFEHWAWSKIIRGEVADMRFAAGKDDGAGDDANEEVGDEGVKTLKPWPESRVLSARFFEAILFHEPCGSAKNKPWVRIRHAWLKEELNWSHCKVNEELWLDQCRIDAEPNWLRARFGGRVSLGGSRLLRGLLGDGLDVEGGLFCSDGFKAEGEVRLVGAHIGGYANFIGAELAQGLNADRLDVNGSLFCSDGFKAGGEVRMVGAHVGGAAAFIGADLMKGLNTDRLNVEGSLFCRGGFKAGGEVNLVGARIGGNAEFDGAQLGQGLRADALELKGGLFARSGFKTLGPIYLQLAHVGSAQLRGAFDSVVNLTGARVDGELQFDQGGQYAPTWGEQARLVLRNVSCGALAGAVTSFQRMDAQGGPLRIKGRPVFVPTDLLGLSYPRIGGLVWAGEKGKTLADAKPNALVALLQSDAPKSSVFTPQPYRQLAEALMAAGREQQANKIRFALLEHERSAKGVPFMRKTQLWLSRHLIGHGFENWRAAFLFLVLVALSAWVGMWAELKFEPPGPAKSYSNIQAWLDWAGYGFGNMIPFVTLDKGHETFLHDRFIGFSVPEGLRGFFWTMKLMGYGVLSYLAAGLTGFASRSAR